MVRHLPNSPYFIVVPATSLVVALGSTGLALGTRGVIAGAAFGALWAIALGIGVERLIRYAGRWGRRLADGSVLLVIVASGVMLGGGVMYGLLMTAAAAAPADMLSAMMQPTIPFFILLNTPLELLGIPCAVFANWQHEPRRRLILPGAASFYAMRVWSYLAYVPARMDIASHPLSPQDIKWFQQSMAADYRPILVAIVFVLFAIAASVPVKGERYKCDSK